jgi:hypothetical protein
MGETQLKKIKTADKARVPFECPRCHRVMRGAKPDGKHPIPSIVNPCKSIIGSDVVIRKYVCENPKCKKTFVVYWFEPRDFFDRI